MRKYLHKKITLFIVLKIIKHVKKVKIKLQLIAIVNPASASLCK